VTDYAHRHRFIYQVFDFPYPSETLESTLERKGYGPHPQSVPPTGLYTATLILDIQPSLENLLKNMHTTTRKNIRKAERTELTFELGKMEHLDTFWELMLAICSRRGEAPGPSSVNFFKELWIVAEPAGLVRLFLVRLNDEVVSAAFVFTLGDTLRAWKMGWSGLHPHKHPTKFMLWSMVKWAKENGFKYFDFVWLDDHDAKLLVCGEKQPDAFRDGSTFFKIGFSGRVVMIPTARSRFFHPAFRWLNGRCAKRLTESRASQVLLRRLWSRFSG
jgi:lipid II:glycine glycyltransferase (peptidoglycan interpeptide bridge formation enzyme)